MKVKVTLKLNKFINMGKFNIIEEGRLSKSEMAEITGGAYLCYLNKGKEAYFVTKSCGKGTVGSYSFCSVLYISCASGHNKMSCVKLYDGSTGPGGNMVGDDTPPSQSATERDDYVTINWD